MERETPQTRQPAHHLKIHLFVLFACCVVTAAAFGRQFHVAPDGSSHGNGSVQNPWDLQTALNQPSAVQPGDTLWLHGGTYAGYFTSRLDGTADKPIIVRQYPGEWASIDGGDSQQEDILHISGNYTWYWGFEIFSSDPVRTTSETGSFPSPATMHRGTCINTDQDFATYGNKFINLIIHDGFNGFGAWVPANTELYGCVVYNNGWDAPDRSHGHNLYMQNQTGDERTVIDNIIWGGFESNIQAYGTRYIDDFYFRGNVVFAYQPSGRNMLIGGGGGQAHNPRLISNYLYDPSMDRDLDFGWEPYGEGIDGGTVTGNYIMGGGVYMQGPVTNTTISGNTIYAPGGYIGYSKNSYPDNTYLSNPSGTQVFVIPNNYEGGRANIAVYNWAKSSKVSVDVSSVLLPGDNYEVRDAMDYYGSPVASGTYNGGSLSLPMTGLSAVSPVGKPDSRAHTGPVFAAFVLQLPGLPTRAPNSVATHGKGLPSAFELSQNYPNPFNPSTTIEFGLPVAGFTTLKIYSVLGTEVATLLSGSLQPGRYSVVWNARSFPSGIYFYRLESGAFSATRRTVLLK